VPGGAQRLLSQAGGSTGLLMDLAANEKAVHADFFNGKGRRVPDVGGLGGENERFSGQTSLCFSVIASPVPGSR